MSKIVKIFNNCQNCQKSLFPYHSDETSQRSQVSKGHSLHVKSKSRMSQSVSQWQGHLLSIVLSCSKQLKRWVICLWWAKETRQVIYFEVRGRFVLKTNFSNFFGGTVPLEILSKGKHEEALDIVPILSACQVQFHVSLPRYFVAHGFCPGGLVQGVTAPRADRSQWRSGGRPLNISHLRHINKIEMISQRCFKLWILYPIRGPHHPPKRGRLRTLVHSFIWWLLRKLWELLFVGLILQEQSRVTVVTLSLRWTEWKFKKYLVVVWA